MNVWTFEDLSQVAPIAWSFPVNPNQMDPPELPTVTLVPQPQAVFGRRFSDTHTIEPHSELVVMQQPTVPTAWTFQGVLYTLEDVTDMTWWVDNTARVQLTDHRERSWLIQLVEFEQVRAQSSRWRERHTYTMHCLMLGRLA